MKDSLKAFNGYHKMSRSVSHKTSTHPIVALSIDIILSVIPSLVSHSIPFLSSPLYAHNGHVRRLITHVTLTSIFFDIRVSYSPLPFISAAHTLRAIFFVFFRWSFYLIDTCYLVEQSHFSVLYHLYILVGYLRCEIMSKGRVSAMSNDELSVSRFLLLQSCSH